jgi:hypothetical protein
MESEGQRDFRDLAMLDDICIANKQNPLSPTWRRWRNLHDTTYIRRQWKWSSQNKMRKRLEDMTSKRFHDFSTRIYVGPFKQHDVYFPQKTLIKILITASLVKLMISLVVTNKRERTARLLNSRNCYISSFIIIGLSNFIIIGISFKLSKFIKAFSHYPDIVLFQLVVIMNAKHGKPHETKYNHQSDEWPFCYVVHYKSTYWDPT